MAENRFLSLEECRSLAINNNKELRMADTRRECAYYQHKSAVTKYLPRISATGIYMRTGDEVSLLSDRQKTSLSNLEELVPFPGLPLNAVGESLTEALRTDTRNMTAVAVMLTQPVYAGGQIRAYNKITNYAESIAGAQADLQLQELIVKVDETYWKVVELHSKKELAEGYINLLSTLDYDVQQLISEGLATKADGLSVRVKLNEAKVTLIQVENGLTILKNLLCQLCGLDMNTTLTLADENVTDISSAPMPDNTDMNGWHSRPELRILEESIKIEKEKVKIARSEFLPTVALTGGYLLSNPSLFNGFEKKFNGTWGIGVAVNIPLVTCGERFYKVKEAKAKALIAELHLEENKEKIELQVRQSRQKMTEAYEHYEAAISNQKEADENLRCATIGLKEGIIPVSNVIEAQTAWLSARSDLISASVNEHIANIYLLKSLGQIK